MKAHALNSRFKNTYLWAAFRRAYDTEHRQQRHDAKKQYRDTARHFKMPDVGANGYWQWAQDEWARFLLWEGTLDEADEAETWDGMS